MSAQPSQRTISIPEGVTLTQEGGMLLAKGPLGELRRDLSHMPVTIQIQDGQVHVRGRTLRKRNQAAVGTAAAHVRNLIQGVTSGYTYKLRLVYSHFPVTVKVDEKKRHLVIENFTGEKTPRHARILEGVNVNVQGEEVHVKGLDLQTVSQTAANIQNITRTKKKDQRVFLDGVYLYEKAREM